MAPPLGDADMSAADMAQSPPANSPGSHEPDAIPVHNGEARSNGDVRNGSRTSTLSPDGDATRANDGSDTSTPPQLSHKHPRKSARREPPLFNDMPDMTEEACGSFKVIDDCLYGSKNMATADNDELTCECKPDWHNGFNYACDEDCINRATRVECIVGAESRCGDLCQNQRFQRKLYANISVIKTDKKGYGLRANVDLESNEFVREYIGEVINEPTFRRRMVQYDDEGIKHFYFMSLGKGEFVDATKKGGLGRFCNHSCAPNCYVDKWVVGNKFRMGIFVKRKIRAGEELTFDYNVDRYGTDPQPCYCGEPECVGYIGGKTQTARTTKLPLMVLEALGIDDGDSWDRGVSKKLRKKRADESEQDYVNSLEPRSLTVEGVKNVMTCLFQVKDKKDKWVIVKVLDRIQNTDDMDVVSKVVQLHVYKIMKLLLNTWAEDDNIILQVLDVLAMLPRLTKNKIVDADIENPVRNLMTSEDPRIAEASKKLIDAWDTLELGYRIKRRRAYQGNPQGAAAGTLRSAVFGDDRDPEPSTPTSKPVSPLPANVEIPKGPKSNIPQRNPLAANRGRRFMPPHPAQSRNRFSQDNKRPEDGLPPGWFQGEDSKGIPYYYNAAGVTTWKRPRAPADLTLTKSQVEAQIIQKIIDDANKAPAKASPRAEPAGPSSETRGQETGTEKWRSLPIEKQMKIYENTIFPHVRYVCDKFRLKLPKEELKRLAKDVNKKLAASDYKNKRVQDPTAAIEKSQVQKIKMFVKTFLDKAVAKYQAASRKPTIGPPEGTNGEKTAPRSAADKGNDVALVTPDVDTTPEPGTNGASPGSPGLKRKRDHESTPLSPAEHDEEHPSKRVREPDYIPPPPPPPPPKEPTEEEKERRRQEQELMKENEEAQRLEDEAEGKKNES